MKEKKNFFDNLNLLCLRGNRGCHLFISYFIREHLLNGSCTQKRWKPKRNNRHHDGGQAYAWTENTITKSSYRREYLLNEPRYSWNKKELLRQYQFVGLSSILGMSFNHSFILSWVLVEWILFWSIGAGLTLETENTISESLYRREHFLTWTPHEIWKRRTTCSAISIRWTFEETGDVVYSFVNSVVSTCWLDLVPRRGENRREIIDVMIGVGLMLEPKIR